MRAVALAVPGAGPHADVLPAASVARNWMIVSPSADGEAVVPAPDTPHDAPPSVDRRNSYDTTPESGSTAVLPLRTMLGTFCQASAPPEAAGEDGGVRSMRTVLAASGTDGAHADALPAWSTVRNWTALWPSAVIRPVVPDDGALQLVPPSVVVRNS